MAGVDEESLEQRYGGPSPVVRLVALVLVVAVGLSGAGFLAWTIAFHGSPDAQSRLLTYDVLDDYSVVAELEVMRSSEYVEATCTLAAVAEDHTVVGTLTVPVRSGPEEQVVRVEIRTERRATTVQKVGCTAPGQPRAY